jgi:hypothetical protein
MNPWEIIQALWHSEIDAGIETITNYGIEAWIIAGDGRVSERTFPPREFGEIGAWLDYEARRLFPQSEYVRDD